MRQPNRIVLLQKKNGLPLRPLRLSERALPLKPLDLRLAKKQL
jgi:hypothetical protein